MLDLNHIALLLDLQPNSPGYIQPIRLGCDDLALIGDLESAGLVLLRIFPRRSTTHNTRIGYWASITPAGVERLAELRMAATGETMAPAPQEMT